MNTLWKRVLAAVLPAALLGGLAMAQKQAPQPATNVLLVHGAFADSTSWDKVIPFLKAKGLHVVTVDIPLTSLAEDAAATKKAIESQTGPVLLVGHSYGGTVITEAGDESKVVGLVYVAAYAPSQGQTTVESGAGFSKMASLAEFRKAADGRLSLTRTGVSEYFAPDLSASEQNIVFTRQIPLAAASLDQKMSAAAWTSKPSWYIVSTNDQIINPEQEKSTAKRIGAKATEIPASHVVMLSHPQQTAAVIIKAAAGK